MDLADNNSIQHLASLVMKYHNNELRGNERAELYAWIAASNSNRLKWQEWSQEEMMFEKLSAFNRIDEESAWQKLVKEKKDGQNGTKWFVMKRFWMTAAAVLFVIVGSYFLFTQEESLPAIKQPVHLANDVKAPESNRATIRLANGEIVYLDSVSNGQIIQGGITLMRDKNGQIEYREYAHATAHSKVVYHTLSNPRGSRIIHISLADGSKVWLNAGSSLTYPTIFSNNERSMSMDGEIYFEVARNAKKPFYVTAGDMTVKVLGTHFNVKSYAGNEREATLLEGVVQVKSGSEAATLKPGQQAKTAGPGKMRILKNVDVGGVIAWKEGLFQFDDNDIQTVMQEISRWYDVEVIYPDGIPKDRYWGSIRRDQNLADVFQVLKESGANFKIEGRKVIVMQK